MLGSDKEVLKMKHTVERSPQTNQDNTSEEQTAFERGSFKQSGPNTSKWSKLVPWLCTAVFLAVAIVCFSNMLFVGTSAAGAAFTQAKDDTAEKTYELFYNKGYDQAEKAHHVSSRTAISIDTLREMQKLEVLAVSEVSYQVEEKEEEGLQGVITDITGFFNEESISWLEVPGSGVFTVDLQAGEFIVDEERQMVLIRIPGPELSNFTLDYGDVEILYFDEGGTFKNSAKYGVDKAVEQLQNAELDMRQRVSNNQELYKRAQNAAENMLMNLVQQLNPQLPGLTVEVEFLNE